MKLVKEETAGPINTKIYQKEDGNLLVVTRFCGEVVERRDLAAVDALIIANNLTDAERANNRARVQELKNTQLMVCGDIMHMN